MQIIITSTDQVTEIDGVPCRLWRGVTEAGVPCDVFVHLLVGRSDQDCTEFESNLKERLPPAELVPLRKILPQL